MGKWRGNTLLFSMAQTQDISKLSKEDKIRWAVREYVRLFPSEYTEFKQMIRNKKAELQDEWGQVKSMDVVERALYEMPETLFYGIKKVLKQEEWDWLQAKEGYKKDFAGPRWFTREFKEFTLTKDF